MIRLLGPTGGLRATNFALRHSPRIFMYHRFAARRQPRRLPVAVLAEQLRLLAGEFHVVPMRELIRQIRAHGEIRPYTAVITVDDGYRDFLEHAVPLLRRYRLPATLFVATRFVEGDFWLWPDRLEYALFHSRRRVLDLGEGRLWPLTDAAARWHAWNEVAQRCMVLPHYDKERLLGDVERALGVSVPAAPVRAYRALSVEEIRGLAAEGFEIGAHTQRHPVLSRLPVAELDDEIAGSKHRIEQWLQTEATSFCYPHGTPEDYNGWVKARVQAAGFASAAAAYFHHDVLADLFEIKRYAANDDLGQFQRSAYGVRQVSSLMRYRVRWGV